MYYYKNDSDALSGQEPLGEIVLNEIKSVVAPKDKPGRMDVEVPGRIFALKAENQAEHAKWVAALQNMTSMSGYTKPSHLPSTPAETMKMMASQSSSLQAGKTVDAAQDAIDLMCKGSAFIKYDYEPVTQRTNRDIVVVWYKKDATR
jgi:hypothetical protein